MKKIILILPFFIFSLFANEYYAKIEPINSYKIASSVSGEIIYTNENIEGKYANNSLIIEIDSSVNRVDLKQTKNKAKFFEKMIEIEKNNYERLKKVVTRSDFDKDSQLLKSINVESNYADLMVKIAQLEDTIKNKKLIEKDRYIYNIAVRRGEWVNAGTLLYEVKDLSKGKLEIFVPISDIESIKNKDIYMDGKKSDLKIEKIYKVADDVNISSYKVEILINNPNNFSKLVKIEFK